MPTIVVSSIGTSGRDYSTLQAWEDACPADLVAVDQVWRGECYNDSEFTAGVAIAGVTTDATRYVHLTAAPGQSWIDGATARTAPLTGYDQSRGVGVHVSTSASGDVVQVSSSYTVVERLQLKRTGQGTYSAGTTIVLGYSGAGHVARDLVLDFHVPNNTGGRFGASPAGNVVANSLVVVRSNSQGLRLANGGAAYNCTIVAPTGGYRGAAGEYHYGAGLRNCAIFGFGTAPAGIPNGSYNATDLASGLPGSNNLYSQSAAACFESATADFRLKAGSALIGAGNTDATYAPNDITGTARGVGTAGDIGCWEYTAGGGGGTDIPEHFRRMRRPGVVWSGNTGA